MQLRGIAKQPLPHFYWCLDRPPEYPYVVSQTAAHKEKILWQPWDCPALSSQHHVTFKPANHPQHFPKRCVFNLNCIYRIIICLDLKAQDFCN